MSDVSSHSKTFTWAKLEDLMQDYCVLGKTVGSDEMCYV